MLTVKNLRKTYGSGPGAVRAIDDISFTVAKGEFVSIVGPSGCGKTTLLKCLSGLLTPTAGEVRVDGRVVTSPPPELALVFQDYSQSLMPWLTVAENVMMPLKSKGMRKAARVALMEEAIRSVNLSHAVDRYPWQLSGGMQQRVAIARGLAYQPEIMLMDEPFASVDAQTRADLEDLVRKLWKELGVTVLFVTHDIDESVYLGQRVIVLSNRPTVVQDDVTIDLPDERDQLTTRSDARFTELRHHIYAEIQRAKGNTGDTNDASQRRAV